MTERFSSTSRTAGFVAALAAFGSLCAVANAQAAPPPLGPGAPPPPQIGAAPPPPPGAPRPAGPPPAAGPPTVAGTVVAAKSYRIQIRTVNGRYVDLRLRNGTVINPVGTSIQPGMNVAVRGTLESTGRVATDEIDVAPPAAPRGALPPAAPPPGGPPPPPGR